jgi:hypothetical protein
MAHNIAGEAAERALKHARTWIEKHKSGLNEVVKAGEAAGLPFVIGLAEGRLAADGSGHVEIAGCPVMLLAAAAGTVVSATGYLDEYGIHVGSAAAGCWGSFSGDAGRQIGLKMRAKAGYAIQPALLSQNSLNEVNKYLGAQSPPKKLELFTGANQGARVGLEQYAQVGAAPVFTTATLDAIAANPAG